MRADKATRGKKRELKVFNPTEITGAQIVEWIKLGDIEEARQATLELALFLYYMAENKDAQQAIMRMGVPWIGSDVAKLIAEKLMAEPCSENGKKHKNAIDAFAKILVPVKTSKSQFHARIFATFLYQLGSDSEENLDIALGVINSKIKANATIMEEIKIGNNCNIDAFIPTLPIREITARQFQTAYRRYVKEIKAAEAN